MYIYQLSVNPVARDDFICVESAHDSGIANNCVEVIVEVDDPPTAHAELVSHLTGENGERTALLQVGRSAAGQLESITLMDGFMAAYYAEVHENVRSILRDAAATLSIETVADGRVFNSLNRLHEALDDPYGYYISLDGHQMTIDLFLRRAEEGVAYHVGGTLEYWC